MSWILRFWESTVGKKALMGITGAIGIVFVMVHLVGNLQFYLGPEVINAYAVKLHALPPLVWASRVTLMTAVLVHVICYLQLGQRTLQARPVGYQHGAHIQSSLASRTMRWTGPFLALFIAYHLLHLTWGKTLPGYDPANVYGNMVNGFRVWWASLFYIVAMAGLGYHLIHGSWSMWSSLGINHPKYNPILRGIGVLITTVVVVGNISMPLVVLLGIIK